MKELITVAEFIKGNTDIDIVDDVCEELFIAVCRPVGLTEEGERKFAEVLGYEVSIIDRPKYPVAILHISNSPDWEKKLHKAMEFFWAHAGYCDADDWDKWFYFTD